MAKPTTSTYGAGKFWIGDDDPETPTFTAPCGFTQGELKIDKSLNDTTVPDCDDPDAPAWVENDVQSQSWTMSFQGVLATESVPIYEAAVLSSKSVPVRQEFKGLGTGSGTPDKRYEGNGHITMTITSQLGQKTAVQIDVTGDGPLTPTSITIA